MTTGARFRVYFDSGVLVKLYHLEAGSRKAAEKAVCEPSLPLSFLAEMEVRNALRVLHGRGALNREILKESLQALDSDIRCGRLRHLRPNPDEVEAEAEKLSRKHAAATLCRTLDLLHVSTARVSGIPRLCTGDKRQADLAARSGLKVDFWEI